MSNTAMKVLIVIPYLAAVYGGPARVAQELAKSLGRLNVVVDLITTNANGLDTLNVPLDQWIKKEGYRVQYFNCWHRNDFIVSFSLLHWLIRNIAVYNLVHVNNIFAPLMLATEWLCQLKKVPYVVTPHGMLEPWAMSYKVDKKQLYYSLLEVPTLKRAKAIHALNKSEANHIQSLGFHQTIIVPNGIDQKEFNTLFDPEIFYRKFPHTRNKTIILFLGRVDPKKGLDLLAPAFASAYRQFPDIHLVVAGPDSIGFLPTAQSYFIQAECIGAVTFTGMLTGNLKRSALSAASIYVAPSYSEGFSMSILEGMASGLPCIITTGCNFSEAMEANTAFVVSIDVDAIATAIIYCLNNQQAAKEIGNRARKFIFQNYTWHHAAEKLVQTYAKITDEKDNLKNAKSTFKQK